MQTTESCPQRAALLQSTSLFSCPVTVVTTGLTRHYNQTLQTAAVVYAYMTIDRKNNLMTIVQTTPQLLLSMPGGAEWIWIMLAIILLFGGRKLPELARGIGKGIREFKEAKEGVKTEIEKGVKED